MHPEKGPRERLVRPLCSLSPGTGCQGKACLSTCCLSSGVPKEAPREGLSVDFVALYGASQCTSKNSHPIKFYSS